MQAEVKAFPYVRAVCFLTVWLLKHLKSGQTSHVTAQSEYNSKHELKPFM